MIQIITDEQWLCATVYQEARGEPYEGKLAVAYVVLNRCKERRQSIPDVVLAKWQFSAWNTDSPTRMTLDTINFDNWKDCSDAVTEAMGGKSSDPTHGANAYLNIDTVIRVAGKLPSWYDAEKVTVTIGHHTFLKI